MSVANVFYVSDGNLYSLILFDANRPGDLERTEEMGGTISNSEYGVGIEKIEQMCHQFSSAELQQMHALKAAFDSTGLLNPGKAVPTLHRCAEFGAMHMHHDEVPFPELERF